MAFQTRCPECRAKLKFDEAPEPEEAIECPRCGHVFDASEAKPIKKKVKALAGGGDEAPRKKKKSGKKGEKGFTPKKRKARKKKSNLLFLWIMLAGAVLFGPFVGYVAYKLFFSTGKMGMLMGYVPQDCNLLRGVDLERFTKLKGSGYGEQLKAAMKGGFDECRDEFSKSLNVDPATFLEYAMSAKIRDGGKSGAMFIFLTTEPFDSQKMVKGLGGTSKTVDGVEVFQLPGDKPGVLAGAYVFFPAEKQIVLIQNTGDQMKMLKASLAAKSDPKGTSFMPKLGETGNKVCRGHVWTLMKPTGDLKGRIQLEMGDKIKGPYPALSQRLNSATMFGTYMYFGGYIKFGIAIETDSSGSASDLAKTMRDGPLGKGDDSEFHRDLWVILPLVKQKEFAEFMSNLRYLSLGNCSYLESKMGLEKAILLLSYMNRPEMWEATLDAEGNTINPNDTGGGRRR